jgi:hypothetical protein
VGSDCEENAPRELTEHLESPDLGPQGSIRGCKRPTDTRMGYLQELCLEIPQAADFSLTPTMKPST